MQDFLSLVQASDTTIGIISGLLLLLGCWVSARTFFPGDVQKDERGNEIRDKEGKPIPFPQGAGLFYHLCATTVNALGLALGILAIFGLHLPYSGVCLVFASVIGYVYFEWRARKYDDRAAMRGWRGEDSSSPGLNSQDVKQLVTALEGVVLEGYKLDATLKPVRRSSEARAKNADLVEVE